MKKVLIIARAFPPFQSVGHSIRVVKFVKYLPALGWLPSVLTIDDGEEYETDRKQGSETLLSQIPAQVSIYRTAAGEPSLKWLNREGQYGQRHGPIGRIVWILGGARRWAFRNLLLPDRYVTWLPFALRRGRQIVRSDGIDVVFVTCPPHSASLIGIFLKVLSSKPLVVDFRDDWIDTPWYRSKSTVTRLMHRWMERWAVKAAAKVVLVTEWSRNAFVARYPTQPTDKFAYIPNGVDLGDFSAVSVMPPLPDQAKFVIVHAGSLNVSKFWGRSPVGLFQAIQQVLLRQPELEEKLALVLVGDLPEEYRRLAEEMGLKHVIRDLGPLPHDNVLRLLKSADMLLAINYEGWSSLIPAKIYEYWAVGGPPILLLSCQGAASMFVERHGLGLTVDPCDVAGIRQAILAVYAQRGTAAALNVNTAGIENYDRQALTRELAQVLSAAM